MKDIEQKNRKNKLNLSGDHKDRTGLWYGRLQAIRQTDKAPDGRYNWLCLCSCLGTREVSGVALDSDEITHCGCEDLTEDEDEEIEQSPLHRTPPRNMPVWMTMGQLDLFMQIVPPPLGQGLSILVAAKNLNISYDAANRKLQTFKKRFPGAWSVIKGMQETMARNRDGLDKHKKSSRGMLSFDCLVKNLGEDAVQDMIIDKF